MATLERIQVNPGDTITWRPAPGEPSRADQVRATDAEGILTPSGRVAWDALELAVVPRAGTVSHVGYPAGHWKAGDVEIAALPHGAIEPHPDNPRKRFDPEKLQELAESIRAQGILQPLLVRPRGQGRYQLICGERRWRAAGLADQERVPAIIRPLTDEQAAEAMLLENIQRQDLTAVEEARSLAALLALPGQTQASVGERIGRKQGYVSGRVGLLRLPEVVLNLLDIGDLEVSKAETLLGLIRWPERVEALARQAVTEGWSTQALAAAVSAVRQREEAQEQPSLALDAPTQLPAPASEMTAEPPAPSSNVPQARPVPTAAEIAAQRADERASAAPLSTPKTPEPPRMPEKSKSGVFKTAEEKVAERTGQPPAPKAEPTEVTLTIPRTLDTRMAELGLYSEPALTLACDIADAAYDHDLEPDVCAGYFRRFLAAVYGMGSDPEAVLAEWEAELNPAESEVGNA